jgi:hypothetical protein
MAVKHRNQIDQTLIRTIIIIMVGVIWLVLFHEDKSPRCSSRLSAEKAIERGCPAPNEEVRASIMRV